MASKTSKYLEAPVPRYVIPFVEMLEGCRVGRVEDRPNPRGLSRVASVNNLLRLWPIRFLSCSRVIPLSDRNALRLSSADWQQRKCATKDAGRAMGA